MTRYQNAREEPPTDNGLDYIQGSTPSTVGMLRPIAANFRSAEPKPIADSGAGVEADRKRYNHWSGSGDIRELWVRPKRQREHQNESYRRHVR